MSKEKSIKKMQKEKNAKRCEQREKSSEKGKEIKQKERH